MKKMYKKPEIETTAMIAQSGLMKPPSANEEMEPNLAPGRATSAGDPY